MNPEATLPRAPSTTLAVATTMLKYIGAVGPVLVAKFSAPQHVNVLVMVRDGEVGRTDNDLPVSVPVAWLGSPLTHSAQYSYSGSKVLYLFVLQSCLKPPPSRCVVLRGPLP